MKVINRIIVCSSLLLSSCATVVPVEISDQDNHRCELSTKKRSLDVIEHTSGLHCTGGAECLAALGVGVVYTATTTVISGSIMILGNTVHWLEKQGKCDDGFLNFTVKKHNDELLQQDAKPLEAQGQ